MPLEVFQAPATLRDELIEFQARQQCHPLTELEQFKDELAGYVGVYLLYYRGQFPLYADITYANQAKCCMPIYIGKAENPGKRTGKGTIAGGLIGRLREHIATAKAVRTLNAKHVQWHLANNQIAPLFCGCDFLTKTSISQSS